MDGFDWPYPIKAQWSINPCVTQERGGGGGGGGGGKGGRGYSNRECGGSSAPREG